MGLLYPELRRDLDVYDGETKTLLREPSTGRMLELNPLQFEVAKKFDGKSSPSEVSSALQSEYGVEVPVDFVVGFERTLGSSGLLTGFRVEAPVAQKTAALAALRKIERAGLVDPPTEHPDAREAVAIALTLLRRGEINEAIDYFALCEEIDPPAHGLRAYRDIAVSEAVRAVLPAAMAFPGMVFPRSQQIVDLATRLFGFLCTRTAVIVQVLLALSGFVLLLFVERAPRPAPPDDPLQWIIAIASSLPLIFLHELGHAVSCRHFGGKVKELGLMLIFGVLPAAYADITAAHTFPERRHRIWTSLAGPLVSVQLGAIAGWLSLALPPTSPFQPTLHAVFAANCLIALFNLVPFMPLDGYFILSDLVGVENLRARALARVSLSRWVEQRGVVRAWLGFSAILLLVLAPTAIGYFWVTKTLVFAVAVLCLVQVLLTRRTLDDPAREEKRQQRILFWYGVGCRGWTVLWVGLVLIRFYGVFVRSWRGAGFILFLAVFVLPRLRNWLFPRTPRPNPASAALRKRARIVALGGFAVAAAVLAAVQAPKVCRLEGKVMTLGGGEVRATGSDVLEELFVKTGDRVRVGQLVGRLRDPGFSRQRRNVAGVDLSILRAEAALAEKRAALALATAGMSDEERRALRASAAAASARLRGARGQAERLAGLEGLESGDAIQQAQDAASAAAVEVQRAVAVGTARAELDPALIARLAAEVRALELVYEDLHGVKGSLDLISAFDGVVTTRDLELKLGSWVEEGETILEVHSADPFQMELQVPVDESAADVREGMRVTGRLVGAADVPLEGRLETIGTRLVERDGAWVLVGTAQLHGARRLPPKNATVAATVHVGSMSLLRQLLLPVQAYFRIDFWQLW